MRSTATEAQPSTLRLNAAILSPRALLVAGADATLRIYGALKSAPLHKATYDGWVEVVRDTAWYGVNLDTADA